MYGPQTDRLNLPNNRKIETYSNQPMTDDKLNTSLAANTIMAKLTNHFQRIRLITPPHHRVTNTIHLTLKMTSAQVVETLVTNNSSFRNYPHPDDHTIRTTDTPGFKPFATVAEMILNQLIKA